MDAIPDSTVAAESPTSGLWDIVAALPDEFRAIVVLFYYEDISTRDIAKMLRISEGTVKSRLFRAREKLRKALESDRRQEREKLHE